MIRWQLHARTAVVGLPLLLQLSVSHAADNRPWWVDAGVELGRNDNIGNAERSRDIVEDNFATITFGAGYNLQLDPLQSVSVRGFVETEQVQEVRTLSRYTGGAELSYRLQMNQSPAAPALEAGATAQLDDYDHNQRDSTITTVHLAAIQPIGERAQVSVGIEYQTRDSSGSVWDLNHVRGFLTGDFAFLPGWAAYGSYSYTDGDVASTVRTVFPNGVQAGDIFGLVNAAKDIEPDQAFNEEFSGRWLAYRLAAKTNTFKAGLRKDLGQGVTADLSLVRVLVDAKGDNEYQNWIYRASLQKRF